MKKVLITGASGFIGHNLYRKLIENNNSSIRVLLHSEKAKKKFSHNTETLIGDITDQKVCEEACNGVDEIYHCAAIISFKRKDKQLIIDSNVKSTTNLIKAAVVSDVNKLCYVSACAVFGYRPNLGPLLDESSEHYLSEDMAYAYSKKKCEEILLTYKDEINILIANISTVYGEGDYKLNSGSIIKNVYKGTIKLAPPGGTTVVNIKDVVDGLVLIMEKGTNGERYILANEHYEYKEMLNIIAETLKVKKIKFVVPRWTKKIAYFVVLLMTKLYSSSQLLTPQIVSETYGYKYFSSNKARKELGWDPKYSFKDSIKQAMEFYHKEGLM